MRLALRGGLRLLAPGVAEHAHQVREIAVAAHEARPAQDALEGVLDEVLGVVAGAAERVGRAVQALAVVARSRGREADVIPGRWAAAVDGAGENGHA